MKKIRSFFYKWFFIGQNFHSLRARQKVCETQIDFLIRNSNRIMRRKWRRMLLNKRGPFYIGDNALASE